jgi:hypothetical protein
VHDDRSEVNLWVIFDIIKPHKCVLHPVLIISLWEIVSSVSSSRFFTVLSSVYSHFSLKKEVFKLKSFDQISVPNVATIGDANMLVLLRNVMKFRAALF